MSEAAAATAVGAIAVGPNAVGPNAVGPNAIGATLGLLGDEWTLLIVQQALRGAHRFSQLQTILGIAPTVLSSRLAALTAAGVLDRVPAEPRHDYRLTEAGRALWRPLLCIWAWEQRWVQGEALPTMRHLACGKVFEPRLCCAGCGIPAEAADVELAFGPSGQMDRSIPTGSNRRRAGAVRPDGPGLFPETMTLLGNRWSSALLGAAFLGAQRFIEFEATLGAPPNIISERLRTFVALGVLDDTYRLTPKGLALFPTVSALVAWGERWLPAPDGPSLLARHGGCGRGFIPLLRCSSCHEELAASDLIIEEKP